jgi:uncharacterized protein (DUF433 family)
LEILHFGKNIFTTLADGKPVTDKTADGLAIPQTLREKQHQLMTHAARASSYFSVRLNKNQIFHLSPETRPLANHVSSGHYLDRYMKAIPHHNEPLARLIVADPEILGGEPVFRGTRVPVASLFEHLESDCSLDEFLENFPTVPRTVAVAVLMSAQELTLEKVRG